MELMKQSNVTLKYEPATLKLENIEHLDERINDLVQKFKGYTFTQDTIDGAKQSRSELLEARNALEDYRKDVKRDYNKPLKEFEATIKKRVAKIDEPLNAIRDGIKEIEEQELKEREEKLEQAIEEISNEYDVTVDDIERDNRWTNKGEFTNKGNVGAKLKDKIHDAFNQAQRVYERRLSDEKTIKAYCKAQELEAEGWIRQLDYKTIGEVIESIEQYVDEQNKQAAKAQKEAETTAIENEQESAESSPVKEIIKQTIEIKGTEKDIRRAIDLLNSQGFEFLVLDAKEEKPKPRDVFDELGW
ncbi:DUF1351 domain-containing protein [Dolosigranulum pigrum]|uniref:DUF1351 domain-containing protein n=1 Tax=Dolosigranulum pigrum TaxID=29394 RepID=UPI001AD86989|nr:DUF1351 domain-containing protein [Dolosigranulum pigrum]QTJ49183.1 DUF1351 domain-containing protein [Dolosigranulum pigrum]